MFIIFVAGLPRKPKRPFADWCSTYARSFSKAVCSFPTRKNCALPPTASIKHRQTVQSVASGHPCLRPHQRLYRRNKCLARVAPSYRAKITPLACQCHQTACLSATSAAVTARAGSKPCVSTAGGGLKCMLNGFANNTDRKHGDFSLCFHG